VAGGEDVEGSVFCIVGVCMPMVGGGQGDTVTSSVDLNFITNSW
jgi:hypothetical protein